jgi:subtilisin family serine protease
MTLKAGRGKLLGWSLAAALVAAGALAAPAGALSSGGALSPRLAELAKPSVGALPPAKQARALSLAPSGAGSLLRRGSRVLVDVRFEDGAAAGVEALRASGAKIVNVSRRYQTVTAAAKPSSLRAIAGVARVEGVTEDLTPIVYGAEPCEGGSVVSEGVQQLRVKEAREMAHVNGSGVTVGVISDSYNEAKLAVEGKREGEKIATHAAEDVETKDLPGTANTCPGQGTPVNVVEDYKPEGEESEEPADEGRAMLQTVHDMAPGASLAFASAFNGELKFAQNIEKLAKPVKEGGAGAKVIVDDAAYFDEPFFQDGPVAAAVNKVTSEGSAYFSAAGNDNLFDESGHEISSWEAPSFRDSGSCPVAVQALEGPGASHCMNFNPGSRMDNTFGITVEGAATLTVDLQWAEPWYGVGTDLDAFLFEGGTMLAVSNEDNISSGKPVEVLQWTNPSKSARTVQLAINRYAGGAPRLKFALLENGSGVSETEYPTSTGGDEVGPTVFGHSGAASAISVGAIPFDSDTAPEEYSSRGPVTHYFAPVEGNGVAALLGSPEVISKPDVVASDCTATTFFAIFVESEDAWRFCGTSDAAPHAAGIAALMKEAHPSATPEQVRSALLASAMPVGSYGPCAVGAGLIDAVGAVKDIMSNSEAVTLSCKPPVSVPVSEPPTTPTPAQPVTSAAKVPSIYLAKHPSKIVRTRSRKAPVTFRFGSSEAGAIFFCAVDRGRSHDCGAVLSRWFPLGKHIIRVEAQDAAGVDSVPAVFRFRVKRVG